MALMGSKGGTKEWGSFKLLRSLPSRKTMLLRYLSYSRICRVLLYSTPLQGKVAGFLRSTDSYSVSVSVSSNDYITIVFQSSAVRSERSSQLC